MTVLYDQTVVEPVIGDYNNPTTVTFPANLSGSAVLYRTLLTIEAADWDQFARLYFLFDDDTPMASLSQKRDEYLQYPGNQVVRILDLSKWSGLWQSGLPMSLKVGGYNDQGGYTLPRSFPAGVTFRLQMSGADSGVTTNFRLLEDGSTFSGRRLAENADTRIVESG